MLVALLPDEQQPGVAVTDDDPQGLLLLGCGFRLHPRADDVAAAAADDDDVRLGSMFSSSRPPPRLLLLLLLPVLTLLPAAGAANDNPRSMRRAVKLPTPSSAHASCSEVTGRGYRSRDLMARFNPCLEVQSNRKATLYRWERMYNESKKRGHIKGKMAGKWKIEHALSAPWHRQGVTRGRLVV